VVKQSNRTKLDAIGACITLYEQDIKDAKSKGYYPQRYFDGLKRLIDELKAEQEILQAEESKKLLERLKAKAKKAAEPKFGKQD
jgi:hypothetical protein